MTHYEPWSDIKNEVVTKRPQVVTPWPQVVTPGGQVVTFTNIYKKNSNVFNVCADRTAFSEIFSWIKLYPIKNAPFVCRLLLPIPGSAPPPP
jgi:hypothetical protein